MTGLVAFAIISAVLLAMGAAYWQGYHDGRGDSEK